MSTRKPGEKQEGQGRSPRPTYRDTQTIQISRVWKRKEELVLTEEVQILTVKMGNHSRDSQGLVHSSSARGHGADSGGWGAVPTL